MKKTFLKAASLLFLGATLAACGNNVNSSGSSEADADGKTTISFTWWGSEVRHEKYIESIKEFEKQNPDIKVEYEYGSWDDHWKKLATKAASGELPDVIQMDVQYIAQYGTKNQLADMSEFIGNEIQTDDIKESILATGELDGKVFGIPTSVNTMAMLYNPSLVEQGGTGIDFSNYTFDDLVESTAAIAEATGDYGWNDNNDNSTILQYFLRTKGEDLYQYDADGKPEIGFTKENWIEFMGAIADLTEAKAMPTAEVTSNANSMDQYPFSQGKAAYMMTWSNQYLTYKASAAEDVEINLARPFDSENGAMAYRPGFFYSIANASESKEAAAKFVDFLVNSEEANKIIGTERGIPSNDAIKELLYADMTPEEQESSDFLDDIADIVGDPSPIPPIGFAEINTYFKELYAEITYGTMTPEETYDAFTQRCEEIFAENYQ